MLVQNGRLRRPKVVIDVFVYFACTSVHAKYTKTSTKGRVAAEPQYVGAIAPTVWEVVPWFDLLLVMWNDNVLHSLIEDIAYF